VPRNPRPIDHPTMRAAQRVTRIILELPAESRRSVLSFVLQTTCGPEYDEHPIAAMPSSPHTAYSPGQLRLHDASMNRSSGE
jgi:hypothetical protein